MSTTCEEDFTKYRIFLENLAAVASQGDDDFLTIKHSPYRLQESEIYGEIIYLVLQYLADKRCPRQLIAPIARNIVDIVRTEYKRSACEETKCSLLGGTPADYDDPIKLKNITFSCLTNFCSRLLDNVELTRILPATSDETDSAKDENTVFVPLHVSAATKNRRRYMEDRHIGITDFTATYGIQDNQKASFYGVFDGHDGYCAATYSASQLPYLLATDPDYCTNPSAALRNSFRSTDKAFLQKPIKSGCCAVCALYRPMESRLYVGWVGDSKALLAKGGKQIMQIVTPHKPSCEKEKRRIKMMGGTVIYFNGSHRVNGWINVSRAIGDRSMKPYVSSEPDIVCLELDKTEDFLVLACDGLWDFVSDEDVAATVYDLAQQECDNLDAIPKRLIELAKQAGSADNISIIIVFLRHPSKISRSSESLETMESPTFDNCNMEDVNNPSQVFASNDKPKYDPTWGKDQKYDPWGNEETIDPIKEPATNPTSDTETHEDMQLNHPFNDGLNNILQVNNTNSTVGIAASDPINVINNCSAPDDNFHNFEFNQQKNGSSHEDNNFHHHHLNYESEQQQTLGGTGFFSNEFTAGGGHVASGADGDLLDEFQMEQKNGDEPEGQQMPRSSDLIDAEGDFGPETCVDVTDDVAMVTENSDTNLLEQSTLSRSNSDTLPSSENCLNPFDNKNVVDEFQLGGCVQMDTTKSTPMLSPDEEEEPAIPAAEAVEFQFNSGFDNHQIESEFQQTNGHISPEKDNKSIEDYEAEEREPEIEKQEVEVVEKECDFSYEQKFDEPKPFGFEDSVEKVHDEFAAEKVEQEQEHVEKDDCNKSEVISDLDDPLSVPEIDKETVEIELEEEADLNKLQGAGMFLTDCHQMEEEILQKVEHHMEEEMREKVEIEDFSSTEKYVSNEFYGLDREENHFALDEGFPTKEVLEDVKEEFETHEQEISQEGWTERTEAPIESEVVHEQFGFENGQTTAQSISIEATAPPAPVEEPQKRVHESCDESDDEWDYLKAKEGQGEKQAIKSEVVPVEEGVVALDDIEEKESDLEEKVEQEQEKHEEKIVERLEELNLSKSSTQEQIVAEEEEDDDEEKMNSQLNPDAKEFVPTFSPTHTSNIEFTNGFNGDGLPSATPRHILDSVVSQSPRKGRESNMENIFVPNEEEFDVEIASRPHELFGDEAGLDQQAIDQEMNSKEAMHGEEKENVALIDSPIGVAPGGVGEHPTEELANVDMKQSIYVEKSSENVLEDVLNTVQPIPLDNEEVNDLAHEFQGLSNKEDLSAHFEEKDIVSPATEEMTGLASPVEQHEMEFATEPEIVREQPIVVESIPEPMSDPEDCQQLVSGSIPAPDISQELIPEFNHIPLEVEAQEPVTAEILADPVPEVPTERAPEPLPIVENIIKETEKKTTAASKIANKSSAAAAKKVEAEKNLKNLTKTTAAKKSIPAAAAPAPKPAPIRRPTTATTAATTEKPKPAATASATSVKSKIGATTAAAPRPRTAPAAGASTLTKKTTTTTSNAAPAIKSRIDAKPPATLAAKKPLPAKAPAAVSKVGTTARTSSTVPKLATTNGLAAKPRPASASAASATAAKTALSQKSSTLSTKSAPNPKISPRSTLTSTLRKTEAIKSPTKTTTTTVTSRVNSGLKSTTSTKTTTTTTTTTKSSTTGASKPAIGARRSIAATNGTLAAPKPASATQRKSTPIKKPTGQITANGTSSNAKKPISKPLAGAKNAAAVKDSTNATPITEEKVDQTAPNACSTPTEQVPPQPIVEDDSIPKLNGSALEVESA